MALLADPSDAEEEGVHLAAHLTSGRIFLRNKGETDILREGKRGSLLTAGQEGRGEECREHDGSACTS